MITSKGQRVNWVLVGLIVIGVGLILLGLGKIVAVFAR